MLRRYFIISAIIAFVFFWWPSSLFSQATPPLIENISLKEGLKQATIHSIVQDLKGRIWIGTRYGLHVYDGYDFKVYFHDAKDQNSISGNNVMALLADPSGNIWVATQKNGLSRFEIHNEQFQGYRHHADNPNSLSSDRLDLGTLAMSEKDRGILWVGTKGKGLNRLDLKNGRFENFQHTPENPKSLSDNLIRSLMIDRNQVLWVGTKNGFNRFDEKQRQFHRFQEDPNHSSSLKGIRIRSIFEDQQGQFWIGTEKGLNQLNRKTEKFEFYEVPNPDATGPPLGVEAILEDSEGQMWIGTNKGLFQFNRTTKTFVVFPLGSFQGVVFSLFIDNSGVLWIGTDGGGIFKYARHRNKFVTYGSDPKNSNSLSYPNVLSVYQTKDDSIWVGTKNGGANWIDRQTKTIHHFRNDPKHPQSLAADRVVSITEDERGVIWLGTAKGLNGFDPLSGEMQRFLPFPKAKDLEENWINALYHDSKGQLWAGTDFGLTLFSPETGRFQLFKPNTQDRLKRFAMSIYDRGDGQLWVGTKAGLFKFNPADRSYHPFPADPKHPLHQLEIKGSRLYQASDGMLWVATTRGVYGFYKNKQIFEHLTERDGLPSNAVYSLLSDKNGKLWMGTQLGLVQFDPQTKQIKIYDTTDGLLSNEFNSAAFRGSKGEMFFGGIEGLNTFVPEQLQDNPHPPPILLTSFKKFDQNIPLNQPLSEVNQIQLSYQDNFFSFEFAALDYTYSQKNQYTYRLEGLDQDWIQSGTRRYANYTNLDGGKYVFRVKAANSDGVWNEDGIAVRISLPPPPWKTWWAYTGYVLLAVLIVFGYIRIKTQAQAKDLERQRQVNAELVRLDQLKDAFLANTSHELRTPLHGIIGITETLRDAGDAQTRKERIRLLNIVMQSATRLSRLVDDILDFSKIKHHDLPLNLQPLHIQEMVDLVLTMCQPLVGQKDLKLHHQLPADLPQVNADEKRVQQILYNLVGNAIKFTEKGSIEVLAERQGEFLAIHVHDTGVGIPVKQQEIIFEVFVQGAVETREYQEGTGLGLSLTKNLVELHQGALTLESTPGEGSQFTFTLPIAKTKAEPVPAIEKPPSLPVDGEVTTEPTLAELEDIRVEGRPHILVVDDDPVNLQVLLHQLKVLNCSITTAVNGVEALEILETSREEIQLILLDVMMPLMNGYEVCRKIRQEEELIDLPILLLTARNQPEDLIEGFRVGANDYLTKPIHKEELLARVRAHLQIIESIEQLEENERLHEEIEKRRRVEENLVSIQRGLIRILDVVNTELSSSQEISDPVPSIKSIESVLDHLTQELPQNSETVLQELQALPEHLDRIRDTVSDRHNHDKVREKLVVLMQLSLHYWEVSTDKSKAELAEESGIWKVHIDRQGTQRVRTMDKYLNLDTLPKRPNWRQVLQTVYYVLEHCPERPLLKSKLEEELSNFEELLSQAA